MKTTPIKMISATAAVTLRMALQGRRHMIEQLYAPGSREHMRQTHMLAHLMRELGLEERDIPETN